MSGTLAGRTVLVTRPAGLGEHLADLLHARGGEVIQMPVIDIRPPEDPVQLDTLIAKLDDFDLALFISPTAVTMANRAVTARRPWPARLEFAAVGAGTARSLAALGFRNVIAPPGRGDSEALAALPEMSKVRGRRIVIFRGQGGREVLRQALRARGAVVEYCECYRRALPRIDAAPLVERWRRRGVDAVSLTSSEGLKNLDTMLDTHARPLLCRTPVFVPHPRIGEAARRYGIERVIVTGASDEALAEAIADFFAKV